MCLSMCSSMSAWCQRVHVNTCLGLCFISRSDSHGKARWVTPEINTAQVVMETWLRTNCIFAWHTFVFASTTSVETSGCNVLPLPQPWLKTNRHWYIINELNYSHAFVSSNQRVRQQHLIPPLFKNNRRGVKPAVWNKEKRCCKRVRETFAVSYVLTDKSRHPRIQLSSAVLPCTSV